MERLPTTHVARGLVAHAWSNCATAEGRRERSRVGIRPVPGASGVGAASLPAAEPELLGAAADIALLPRGQRRIVVTGLFLPAAALAAGGVLARVVGIA
jgi:hypothetical protein